jgi:hypothetical protein
MVVEQIAAAELLYKLRDRMRDEARYPAHPSIRGTLTNAIMMLDAAAEQTARGWLDIEHADAIADAGELTLRRIIAMRKLRENINHRPNHANGSQA